ncbi:MAG: TlpA family protein disulfide reductase [Phycisphaerales bacterium]|nr:TlpA family protein disulfide reductase [Phycisphaerales bacterium]
MKRHIFAAVLVLAFSASGFASPKIGDKAPKVKAAKWLTKKPPSLPGEKGAEKHVFLVEFWATWCPPCLRSIPHLSKLQKKHEKDGLVILGMSNEEPETIEKFIEKKMKMGYFVASDDDMATSTAWTDDVEYIPYAFLVDKKGNVVWRGNPAGDTAMMDRAIKEVLAGRYDIEAAKNAAAAEKKYKELLSELNPAFAAKNEEKVFEILDKMIELKPLELHPYQIKRRLLREFDRADEIAAHEAKMEHNLKDSASVMRELVWMELDSDLATRNPGLMFRSALRVNELTRGRDAESLAMLAQVQCELGLIDAAIDSQTRAVGLAPKEALDVYKRVLTYYVEVKEVTAGHRERATAQAD